MAPSGSTAITFSKRVTRSRVSLPVPAPRSRTAASGPSSRSSATRSTSSCGHSVLPSSYSRALFPKASGGASLRDTGEQGPLFLDHLAGDHESLNLVRALVDLRDLRVAHHPLDRILLHVAVATEDLDCVRRDLHGHVRAQQLRHRRDLRQLDVRRALVDINAALAETPESYHALR